MGRGRAEVGSNLSNPSGPLVDFSKCYENSVPNIKAIEKINYLHNKGHNIIIFTARFMGRNKDQISKAKKQGYNFTKNQLKKWNLKYDKLVFGKPSFDLFIDDKSIFFKKSWSKLLLKKISFKTN